MVIDFTVKTLDSNNHQLSVEDDITVEDLKQKVHEQLGIDPNLQRLIFCGRVLQDDRKLSEYNVGGKVVHLVQRAPPATQPREPVATTTLNNPSPTGNASGSRDNPSVFNSSNIAMQYSNQQFRRIMGPNSALFDEQPLIGSPTTRRLESIRKLLGDVRTDLGKLNDIADGREETSPDNTNAANAPNDSAQPTDASELVDPSDVLDEAEIIDDEQDAPGTSGTQTEPMDTSNNDEDDTEEATEEPQDEGNAPSSRRRRPYQPRNRTVAIRELCQIMDELQELEARFQPFRSQYTELLRAAGSVAPPRYRVLERQTNQRMVELVTDVIHSLAHVYHALGDFQLQIGLRSSRLTSDGIPSRPAPLQAHINVYQNRRTSPNSGSPNQTTPVSGQTERANEQNAPRAAPLTPASATNITIHPDPITYQVEIETRVPIAFAYDNNLINQGGRNANSQGSTANNEAQNNQNNGQSGGNRNFPRGFPENLYRSLGQQVPGIVGGAVEVVMRMEDLGAQPSAQGGNENQAPGSQSQSSQTTTGESGGNQHPDPANILPQLADILVSPFGGSGNPGADIFQQVLGSVLGQNILPTDGHTHASVTIPNIQGRGHTGHINIQMGPTVHVGHRTASNQNAAQNNTNEERNSGNGSTEPAANGANNGQSANQNGGGTAPNGNAPGRPNLNLRRATQAVGLATIMYDRFLPCESSHAARRVTQIRERYIQEYENARRLIPAVPLEALSERVPEITESEIRMMFELMEDSAPVSARHVNAFLVAVAREIFLTPDRAPGDPQTAEPQDFQRLRAVLRSYIQALLGDAGAGENNALEGVTDVLVQSQRPFFERMNDVAPIRRDVDVERSVRAMIRSRLPSVVAVVMSLTNGEWLVASFFSVFYRFFVDTCALLGYICRDDESRAAVFKAFLEHIMADFDPSHRAMLVHLGMVNLNEIAAQLAGNTDTIRHYIVRREGVQLENNRDFLLPDLGASLPFAMDTSIYSPSPNEPDTTSPSDDSPTNEEYTPRAPKPPTRTTNTTTTTVATSTSTDEEQGFHPSGSSSTSPPSRRILVSSLLRHFGSEWLGVLERDRDTQRGAAPPPSDAYLAGMPARKRRCIRQARPPHTLSGFLAESVQDAWASPSSSGPSGAARAPEREAPLRTALRERIRQLARLRASADDDYRRDRYTAVANLLRSAPGQSADDDDDDRNT